VWFDGRAVSASPSSPGDDWAASGVAHLAVSRAGHALQPAGAPGTMARGLGFAIRALGGSVDDGAALLGARVGSLTLRAGRTVSATGSTRLLRALDGWVAVTLSRPDDVGLVPALVGGPDSGLPWVTVTDWVARVPAATVVNRGALLGLAVARLGEETDAEPWRLTRVERGAAARDRPLVVNLGALWAAPLAAHILHRSGAEVVDIDTGREGEADTPWRRELRDGHRIARADLRDEGSVRRLRALLRDADVVIEASRPRALAQLSLSADLVISGSRIGAWIRVTGHPRPAERAAYGDDAAVAGGLVAMDGDEPVFAGDAIADPLTGLSAALLALACYGSADAWIADISMSRVAAAAASSNEPGREEIERGR